MSTACQKETYAAKEEGRGGSEVPAWGWRRLGPFRAGVGEAVVGEEIAVRTLPPDGGAEAGC